MNTINNLHDLLNYADKQYLQIKEATPYPNIVVTVGVNITQFRQLIKDGIQEYNLKRYDTSTKLNHYYRFPQYEIALYRKKLKK